MIAITRFLPIFSALLLSNAVLAAQPSPGPSAAPKPAIRLLLPLSSVPAAAQLELSTAVEQFNRNHPGAAVQLIRRGDQYSSLRELIAMFLAGDTPEMAVIEASEGPAIAQLEIAKPLQVALPVRKELSPPGKPPLPSLPFFRTVPVLIANQDLLKPASRLPRTWEELETLAVSFLGSHPNVDITPLALPLHGSHGLWIFEALAEPPLWQREQGGLRSERRLTAQIQKLRELLDRRIIQPGETAESATQAFVDGKALFLLTSLDSLPELSRKVNFGMITGPAFTLGNRPAALNGGSDLIITRDSTPIRDFVAYLYSDAIGPKWNKAGVWLPLLKTWKVTDSSGIAGSVEELRGKARPLQFRSTDSEVVRARSAWVQALPLLFGTKEKRVPPEDIFLGLDRQLSVR